MDSRIWRILLFGAWLVLVGTGSVMAAADPAPADELDGRLCSAQYRASAFAFHVEGPLLWLAGPQGLLRLEIGRGQSAADDEGRVSALLQQRGLGWTAILGGPGDDTVNAWGEPWRKPPPGLREVARLVTSALLAGPTVSGEPAQALWRAMAGGATASRALVAPLGPARHRTPGVSAFRSDLGARGLGRGGVGEVVEWRWVQTAPDQEARLRLHSTRRPGRIELSPAQTRPVRYAMPESFVPLWPLAQLLEFTP